MKCNLIEYVKVVFCLIQVGSHRKKIPAFKLETGLTLSAKGKTLSLNIHTVCSPSLLTQEQVTL